MPGFSFKKDKHKMHRNTPFLFLMQDLVCFTYEKLSQNHQFYLVTAFRQSFEWKTCSQKLKLKSKKPKWDNFKKGCVIKEIILRVIRCRLQTQNADKNPKGEIFGVSGWLSGQRAGHLAGVWQGVWHSVLEGGHSDFSQIEPFLYQTVPSYVTRNGGKNFREI